MSKTLQQELAGAMLKKFSDAEVKKIDKDNYLDIHIPSVHPKKGTHVGINTAKGLIKIVFYCREDQFNEQVLANSKKIEAYGQGLRIKDNPTFTTVEKAVEAAIDFVLEIKRASEKNLDKLVRPSSNKKVDSKPSKTSDAVDMVISKASKSSKNPPKNILPDVSEKTQIGFLFGCMVEAWLGMNDKKNGFNSNDYKKIIKKRYDAIIEIGAAGLMLLNDSLSKPAARIYEEFYLWLGKSGIQSLDELSKSILAITKIFAKWFEEADDSAMDDIFYKSLMNLFQAGGKESPEKKKLITDILKAFSGIDYNEFEERVNYFSKNSTAESTSKVKKEDKPVKMNDGEFSEITIGKQIWMGSNLNVTTFRNGDLIPEAKSEADWERAGENGDPAWCYYENKKGNGKKFGKLYNWYAVNDKRGIAPEGWHVASEEEWVELYKSGSDEFANSIASESEWGEASEKELNSTGFSALPAGVRYFSDLIGSSLPLPVFSGLGLLSTWWTSTSKDDENAIIFSVVNNDGLSFGKGYYFKSGGSSVRCIRDVSITAANNKKKKSKNVSSSDFDEMIKAYKAGDEKRIIELIEKGNPPLQFNMDDSVIDNELIFTVVQEEVDLIKLKQIIERGDDLNARNSDEDQYTALHFCAWDGKAEALSLLLENGANPEIPGNDGRTPFHLACALDRISCIKILIEAGVNIDLKIPLPSDYKDYNYFSAEGCTALRQALFNLSWEVIDILLEANADISDLKLPCITKTNSGTADIFQVIREGSSNVYGEKYDEMKLNNLENSVKEQSASDGKNTKSTPQKKISSKIEEQISEVDDEKGYPSLTVTKLNDSQKEKIRTDYLMKWQVPSIFYNGRMGITARIPEWISEIDNDTCCPKFSSVQLEKIAEIVKHNKLIPILKYAPAPFFEHVKHVWWIVPLTIYREDHLSWLMADKNGIHAAYDDDNEIRCIVSWENVEDIDFQLYYEGLLDDEPDLNVNMMTVHLRNGGYITFSEFYDDNQGSYLRVLANIYEVRKKTISASKGKTYWKEGAGGEGFKNFNEPMQLLNQDVWTDNPYRPDPRTFL